jgi:hypothetical protein
MSSANTDTTGLVVTHCPPRKARGAFDAASWAAERRVRVGTPAAKASAKPRRAPDGYRRAH